MKLSKIQMAAGAAVLLALAVLSFLWIFNRYKEMEAEKSPTRIFKKFNNALLSENHREAWGYLSENSVKKAGSYEKFEEKAKEILSSEDYKAELKSTEITEEKKESESRIILTIKRSSSGNPDDVRTGRITMVKEKDTWKIDLSSSSAAD